MENKEIDSMARRFRKKRLMLLSLILGICSVCMAQNVTVKAVDKPAADVFRSIVEQTGKNFVYSSDLLKGMKVTVNVKDESLSHTLALMFKDTDIEYSIKGKNIILKKKAKPKEKAKPRKRIESKHDMQPTLQTEPRMLDELVVVSRLEAPAVETAEIGAMKLTAKEIVNTPVMFGESDVMKALQMQPGISGGAEGMAEMHVHGGNADENMIMLDNVPLYQANHFAGLFSAFNTDATRYIDFFKSSIPAKYDGRLSSYLDVRTKNGSRDRHHGSFRLGLTSGSLYVEGPIKDKTTYMFAMRRSWFDLLSTIYVAILNSQADYEDVSLGYAFTDLNGKITHRFSDRISGFASVYFGNDYLMSGNKDTDDGTEGWFVDEKFKLHWGNIIAQTGINYRISPVMDMELTAAYTRFFTGYKHHNNLMERTSDGILETKSLTKTDNNISDILVKGNFEWNPNEASRVRFGGGYTLHSFKPASTSTSYATPTESVSMRDSVSSYTANEANLYIEDDWKLSQKFRMNAGMHASLFNIDKKTYFGIAPRLSVSYRPSDNWAVKCAYTRTNQYVRQLSQTYLSLPTDQWIPVAGKFKPESADKVSIGGYWQTDDGAYTVSAEGYYKYMRNLVDYVDEYYLIPPMSTWDSNLCTGTGTSKGLDFKLEKTSGKITGHLAYSLGWADRTFAEKNGGKTFPSRFDHRHTINILVNWNISDKVQLNAAWTGHSGNRITLLTQSWTSPNLFNGFFSSDNPLRGNINNYELPFYHRLDLSVTVKNKRGFWNFSLYNAYCNMNTVGIRLAMNDKGEYVFQKVKLIPIIPSVSYTWQF